MNGLFDGGSSSSAVLIILAVLIALLALLFLGRMKRYIDGAKAAGDEIMTLACPIKSVISSGLVYIIIAYF